MKKFQPSSPKTNQAKSAYVHAVYFNQEDSSVSMGREFIICNRINIFLLIETDAFKIEAEEIPINLLPYCTLKQSI